MHSLKDGEIQNAGKVDLAWIQTPLPPVNPPAKAAKTVVKTEDVTMDEGDAMAHTSSPSRAGNGHDEQHDNLDYDVADENDWGNIQ
jgi:RNA-binding protein 26